MGQKTQCSLLRSQFSPLSTESMQCQSKLPRVHFSSISFAFCNEQATKTMRKEDRMWENICEVYIFDKGVVSRIYTHASMHTGMQAVCCI